ncbi:hypothetical protein KY290_008128 [Solanum tuberosum]|uniref:Uncharacterized protein n=1 Tax=Solanum tuberosum TaxID=4113 RepID=A0ABQ7WA75_SOLTU|nr:hypothetical protein KY290_008128 [Solanum tuberosum]
MATTNKTRPSCTRVKVQVDLMSEFPKFVELEVVNEETKTSRVEKVHIQYDMLPKYCKLCKLQGHTKSVCRMLHPELRKPVQQEEKKEDIENEVFDVQTNVPMIKVGRHFMKWHPLIKSSQNKRMMTKKKGGDGVIIGNSSSTLNDECTNKDL